MQFLNALEDRAAAVGGHVVLAEGQDQRIIDAAKDLAGRPSIKVTVLCPSADQGEPHAVLREIGVDVLDPASDPSRGSLADFLLERRKHKGLTPEDAHQAVNDPLYFASLMMLNSIYRAGILTAM